MEHPVPKITKELSAVEVARLTASGFVSVGNPPGLSLQITPTGARSWILRVKVGTKRRDMGLGAYPGVTLAQARQKAREARASIDAGNDPILTRERAQSQLKATQSSAITFEAAARRFITAKTPEWRNAKHAAQWTATLKTYAFPVIGPMHVQDVALPHILKILEPIWASKTETAKRLRGRLENILDWATVSKHRTGENPARWKGHLDKLLSAPSKTTAVVHHPAVHFDQAPAFYAALAQRPGMSARALQFAMMTAARSGETRGAIWAEFDLENKTWTIPAARMKGGVEHRVPLTDAALQILKDLRRLEGSELIFFAPRGGQLSDMALNQVMRRMEVAGVPHGLRSTFRDWVGEKTNFPSELAEAALAHTLTNKTQGAYQRGTMFDKRRAMMQVWADYLTKTDSQK